MGIGAMNYLKELPKHHKSDLLIFQVLMYHCSFQAQSPFGQGWSSGPLLFLHMISKLPRWVWLGGSSLAFLAGMINAVGFMSFQHQGVTHLTGSTTLVGIAAARGDREMLFYLAGIIAFFVIGAALGGFVIQDGALRLGRRYAVALLLESGLLFLSIPLLTQQIELGAYLASCACGLQNGMTTTFTGASVRTTHVTGVITDLSIFLGQWLRGIPLDRRRILLNTLLLLAFVTGAVTGSLGFGTFRYHLLYFPAGVTGSVGLAYGLYATLTRKNRGGAA